MKNLYVVYDKITRDTVGPILVFAHHAPAVRIFTDELANPQTFGRHPADFDLYQIGTLATDADVPELTDINPTVILTGSAWLASQQPREK